MTEKKYYALFIDQDTDELAILVFASNEVEKNLRKLKIEMGLKEKRLTPKNSDITRIRDKSALNYDEFVLINGIEVDSIDL